MGRDSLGAVDVSGLPRDGSTARSASECAGWYGPEFDGKKTANGERFNCEALTAAHPNLPFGSWVRIVNTHNGKFELVRINDRGPYQEGREIDVSYRVARKIGLIHSGVSQVRLELMQLPPKHTRGEDEGQN
jgi:rare lipoprotein A